MTRVRVPIEDEVLKWAIRRTGLTASELARQSNLGQVEAWVEKKQRPTLAQAKNLAKKASIPFGYLLMSEPAQLTPDLPDFRTDNNARLSVASQELEEQIYLCQRSLSWYAEHAELYGAEQPHVVGSVTVKDSPTTVARRMRHETNWIAGTPTNGRAHATVLAEHIEGLGILVMKSSIVGTKTRSRLDRDEFRGFTLIDTGYALIFINTNDAPTANLFSIAHEFGHVLLGKQGVSSTEEHNRIERWCNKFAAAFLLPAEDLTANVVENPDVCHLSSLSQKFGPSVEVITWRLVDLGRITRERGSELVRQWKGISGSSKRRRSSGGGPKPEVLARARLGNNFLGVLSEAFNEGNLPYDEATRLVGYKKVDTLDRILDLQEADV